MPKDYVYRSRLDNKKRKSVSKNNRKSNRFFWRILLLLIILLLTLIFSLIYIVNKPKTIKKVKTTDSVKVVHATPVEGNSNKILGAKKPPIKFHFYTMLPKMKVQVASLDNDKTKHNKNNHYLLQLASLSSEDTAKTYQNKLRNSGWNTHLTVIQRGKTKYYRIQIGPFIDEQRAAGTQEKLRKQDIDSVLILVHTLEKQ